MLTLKKAARAGTASLKKEIANTQRLVRISNNKINKFTYEGGIEYKT